jgi:peptidoglycan/LPS O-acetylase OafA/YrhL
MTTLSVDVPVLAPETEAAAAPAAPRVASQVSLKTRDQTLDAAKAIAAVALVWIHTTQSSFSRFHVLGRFGTAFFVLAAIFFLFHRLGSSPRPSYGTYALKRFRQIYVPFLVWSLIYLLIRDVKRLFAEQPPLSIEWGRLLAGTSMQFWFLPFILLACLVCFPLPPLLARLGKPTVLLAPLAMAIGAYIAMTPRPLTPGLSEINNYFLNNIWLFSPSVFFAIALAIVYPLVPVRIRKSPFLALFGVILTASCIFWLWTIRGSEHPTPPLPRNLAGVGWLLVALAPLRGSLISLLAPLGQYSYGIFLVHPLFVLSMQSTCKAMGISSAGWLDLLVLTVAFLGSYLLTRLLRASRWTSWMIP